MSYTDALANLRKKIENLSITKEVATKIEPIQPKGFAPRGGTPRIAVSGQQPAQPQQMQNQYNPSALVESLLGEVYKSRSELQKRMQEQAKQAEEAKAQVRPQVRPFNVAPQEEEPRGFMTRPVAREDTLQHARANRDTGGFGTPRGPAGSNIGGSLLQLIDRTEGGGSYDTLFGHSQNGGAFDGVRVSEMTLAEAIDFSSQRGQGSYGEWVRQNNPEGDLATPMGRYQIVGSTLKAAVEELGLPLDTRFDSRTQDMIASHLARKRLENATGLPQMRSALRSEWAGFRHVDDSVLDQAILDFMDSGNL
jgi:hypothetical protein